MPSHSVSTAEQLIALIHGSLVHVHRLCVQGLQMVELKKRASKQLARYYSIVISLYIWTIRFIICVRFFV